MNSSYSIKIFSSQALFEALSNDYCDNIKVSQQSRANYLSSYLKDLNTKNFQVIGLRQVILIN